MHRPSIGVVQIGVVQIGVVQIGVVQIGAFMGTTLGWSQFNRSALNQA
jgi:hypothetical protein